MDLTRGNLFAGLPFINSPEEAVEALLQTSSVKLERIVSMAHATPAGQWYDQAWDEWVVLLQGSAALRMEGDEELVCLGVGDYLLLPAHRPHRVEWTDPTVSTIWLALHYAPSL